MSCIIFPLKFLEMLFMCWCSICGILFTTLVILNYYNKYPKVVERLEFWILGNFLGFVGFLIFFFSTLIFYAYIISWLLIIISSILPCVVFV